jgi:hypothetical protein
VRAWCEASNGEAEKQIAGIATQWHKKLERVRDRLKPDQFVDEAMRAAYLVGLEMLAQGLPEDPVLFVERFRLHSQNSISLNDAKSFASGIANNVQSIAHVDYYADLIIEKAQRRERLQFAQNMQKLLADGADLAFVDEKFDEFARNRDLLTKDSIGSFSVMAKKKANQELRAPVIEGIVREGETINVVSDSKAGKTWLVHGLALAVCSGKDWLGFPVQQGSVLVLDNELHEPTFVHRIEQIADALGMDESAYANNLHVDCYRGRLVDINAVVARLKRIPPFTYKLVILDSLYRFAPPGFDENSNSDTTTMYNLIDTAATAMGCAIVCVRHTSKGSQSNKSVTDTGAGAGAQSRAADCHLVLRAHEQEGAFVLAAALRSFPKIDPRVIRFEWPLFIPAPELDPASLAPEKFRKPKGSGTEAGIKQPEWTAARLAAEVMTREPKPQAAIIADAIAVGLSERRAKQLLDLAARSSPPLAHPWLIGDRRQKYYANVPQTTLSIVSGSAE